MIGEHIEAVWGVAKPEVLDGGLAHAAILTEIAHSLTPDIRIKEAGAEEARGLKIHLQHALSGNAALGRRILTLTRKRNARTVGQILHRLGEIQILGLLHEGDHASTRLTAEAIEQLFGRGDREGGRLLTVEGATAHQIGAAAL